MFISCDQGTLLCINSNKRIFELIRFTQKPHCPYHPQYSGKVGTSHGILKLKWVKLAETLEFLLAKGVLISPKAHRVHLFADTLINIHELVTKMSMHLQTFIFYNGLCPTTCAWGKILQEAHVPYSVLSPSWNCLPSLCFRTKMFLFIGWNITEKLLLNLIGSRFIRSLTTKTVNFREPILGFRFHN